ncbi:MAG: LUD domain-containing protein [Miltoncostaeaceae bacterium]
MTALADRLIAALTRRRGSGAVVAADEVAGAAVTLLGDWAIERAVIADDPVLDRLGVADALGAAGIEVLRWPTDRATEELLGLEGPTATCGITVPVGAAAERGTLALAAGPGQGRAIDAASAYHLAILPEERLVASLEDALAAVYGSGRPPSAVSLVSAPSRTSDIEKISTLGAHGALGLHAMVVRAG